MTIQENTKKYYSILAKQYYEATGDNQASLNYIIGWHAERQYVLNTYAQRLEYLADDNDRFTSFLENPVEVGEIGPVNSVSDSFDILEVVSPYAYLLDKQRAHTGKITVFDNDISFIPTDLTDNELPLATTFKTFITQNPDFKNDTETLDALKNLAWQFPSVAVSIMGSTYDKDIKQKIISLREYLTRINAHYCEELIGKIVGPIVKEMFYEEDGLVIDTLITDQYTKLLLPPEILKGLIQGMPGTIQGARASIISGGKGMCGR